MLIIYAHFCNFLILGKKFNRKRWANSLEEIISILEKKEFLRHKVIKFNMFDLAGEGGSK